MSPVTFIVIAVEPAPKPEPCVAGTVQLSATGMLSVPLVMLTEVGETAAPSSENALAAVPLVHLYVMPVDWLWFAAAAGSSTPKFMLNVPVVNLQVPLTVAETASVAVSPAAAGAAKDAASNAQSRCFLMVFLSFFLIGKYRINTRWMIAPGARPSVRQCHPFARHSSIRRRAMPPSGSTS